MVTVLVLAAALVSRSALAADTVPGAPRFPLERYRLANGLEVLLHEDHTVPLAYVSVWYHAGSGVDLPGKSGLAHLCEHMMFEGSRHVKPGEHFQVLGVAGNPDANATTAQSRTNYFETVPAHQLETVLWLESDRMSYLVAGLDQARFDNQREVVRNERRQRYENAAFGPELFAIAEALYPEGHPYRHLTIGRHDDLQGETLADAAAFMRKWYRPSNATLLIAGDFDRVATKAMVEKWFATLPGGGARPGQQRLAIPVLAAPRRKVVYDPFTNLSRIHYIWPTPVKAYTDADLTLDMLAAVLARRPTGRLWALTAGSDAVAQGAGAYHSAGDWGGEFHVYIDVRPTADPAEAEAALQAIIQDVVAAPVTEREVRQVVAAIEAGTATGLETLSARGEQMQSYNHYRGDPDSFGWRLATARKLTPQALRAAAQRTLGSGRVEVITVPEGTGP
jgi:predicted Zn-dependent peptidase